jgi:hypothetical protein
MSKTIVLEYETIQGREAHIVTVALKEGEDIQDELGTEELQEV